MLKRTLGMERLYFQRPENTKLEYPCAIYALDKVLIHHANNLPYLKQNRYSITIMDKDPDSALPGKLLTLPMCTMDRLYTADNLNHWVFTLYF